MKSFKEKSLKLLVATDVAARGIDVNNLTHVINYNLPDEVEQYTHRSGRTGRADKSGKSIVIINSKEQNKVRRIEKIISKTFAKAKVPTGHEVCSKQLLSLIDQIDNVDVREEIDQYLPLVSQRWENLSREEIISKFLSLEFNRFLDYYRNAQDLNIQERERGGKEDGEYIPKHNEKGFEWVKFNIGSRNNLTTRHILRMLTSLGVGKKAIGKVEIRREEAFVGIEASAANYVVEQTNGTEYRGRKIWVEIAGKNIEANKSKKENDLVSEDGTLNRDAINKIANELEKEDSGRSRSSENRRSSSREDRYERNERNNRGGRKERGERSERYGRDSNRRSSDSTRGSRDVKDSIRGNKDGYRSNSNKDGSTRDGSTRDGFRGNSSRESSRKRDSRRPAKRRR